MRMNHTRWRQNFMNGSQTLSVQTSVSIFVPDLPLILIIVGTTLNSLTLFIFCRPPFRDLRKQSAIHYMRVIAVFDILMLYGWNLEHYLSSVYRFTLETYSIGSCKFFLFLGYFTTQTTAWIRVVLCLERFLSLRFQHRTCFSKEKTIKSIIILIISLFCLVNLHLIIFGCHYTTSGLIDVNSSLYMIFPMWDYLNLILYNAIPFVLLISINSGSIFLLIRLNQSTSTQNSRMARKPLSIVSAIMTLLFLVMTLPAGITFSIFKNSASPTLLRSVDSCLFIYHTLSFPLYMMTFGKFRRAVYNLIKSRKRIQRVQPAATINLDTGETSSRIKFKAAVSAVQFMNRENR